MSFELHTRRYLLTWYSRKNPTAIMPFVMSCVRNTHFQPLIGSALMAAPVEYSYKQNESVFVHACIVPIPTRAGTEAKPENQLMPV
jgi:hypothetical protein